MTDHDGIEDVHAAIFEQQRQRLVGVAYGMLGSIADAEDVVQEVYLRWSRVDPAEVDTPAAFLATIATRLSINELRSARRRRESYVGPWLPEPLVTDFDADPADIVAEAERLSLGLLTSLEELKPVERAVFLLRDVFDLDYSEIADVVDRTPDNCRQIASRARNRVKDPGVGSRRDTETESGILSAYLDAVTKGDVEALAAVFAEDVVLWADGGGKVRAALHPLFGAWRVARHLVGVTPESPLGMTVEPVRANGDPAWKASIDGRCVALIAFDILDGRVSSVRAILNPDKLQRVFKPPRPPAA